MVLEKQHHVFSRSICKMADEVSRVCANSMIPRNSPHRNGNIWFRKNAKETNWIFRMVLLCCWLVTLTSGDYLVPSRSAARISTHDTLPSNIIRAKRQANVSVFRHCGENITVTNAVGHLTSPGYPNAYQNSEECHWYLETRSRSTIVLRIVDLEIEESVDCKYDYLKIYTGPNELSPKIGHFCGVVKNKEIKTGSRAVFLTFNSDLNYNAKGFLIEYRLASRSARGCKSSVSGSEGMVTSPNYPNNYPDSTDCWTLITTAPDTIISLQFEVLELEFDDTCSYDYVEVFDGPTKESPSLGKFCADATKPSRTSSGNSLLLHFHSDQLLNNRGFAARFSTNELVRGLSERDLGGCLVEKGERSGTITSPNFPGKYPSEANCIIKLEGSIGQTFSLKFEAMQIEIDENCTFDRVEVYDGFEPNSILLGKFCSSSPPEEALNTRSNQLLVKFVSDDFAEFSGFKAVYTILGGDSGSDSGKPSSKPKIQAFGFLEKPENASILQGDVHILRCKPDDVNAKISWLKDNELIERSSKLPGLRIVNNNLLWIQSMSPSLEGRYGCLAQSDKGQALVHGWISMRKPTAKEQSCNIVLRKRPVDMTLSEGDYGLMQCNSANSSINISWEYNGKPLSLEKQGFEALQSGHLFISQAIPEDGGIYTCIAQEANGRCVEKVAVELRVIPRVNIEEICGKPRIARPNKEKPHLENGKIVGGYQTKPGAYPWQVMLWEPRRKSFCGGTLLNERWVLTAAHCFRTGDINWQEVDLFLGKYDQTVLEEHQVSTKIKELVMHPNYSPNTFDNDIALLQMKDHVNFTDYILPACLGTEDFIKQNFFGSRTRIGTVTGWGQIHLSGPQPKKLLEIRLPIVEDPKCRNSTHHVVTKNMFCAGYAQEIVGDACKGDSGGPFVIEQNSRWYIVGVVSWGEGCAQPGKYGFYTKVSNYHSWIKQMLAVT